MLNKLSIQKLKDLNILVQKYNRFTYGTYPKIQKFKSDAVKIYNLVYSFKIVFT